MLLRRLAVPRRCLVRCWLGIGHVVLPKVHPMKGKLPCEVLLVALVRRGQCRDVAVDDGVNPRGQRAQLQVCDGHFKVVLAMRQRVRLLALLFVDLVFGAEGRKQSREARSLLLASNAAAIDLYVVLHRQQHQKGLA
ncbi:hypothetical protein D3C71_1124780 [compost metagenome]